MRYSALSRRLAVGEKMLTQTLRSLERDGPVIRRVTPTVPVTVTYELTDLGLSLPEVMHRVKDWAEATWARCSPAARSTTPATPEGCPSARREPRCRTWSWNVFAPAWRCESTT
jgi:DNA-binding HxlR family transcriptional regulator